MAPQTTETSRTALLPRALASRRGLGVDHIQRADDLALRCRDSIESTTRFETLSTVPPSSETRDAATVLQGSSVDMAPWIDGS